MNTTNKILTALTFVAFCISAKAQSAFIVNEIQVANLDQFIDHSYNYGGWIELYNPNNGMVDVSYWYVSDNPSKPTKARIAYSEGVIPAKGYKVLWFDHHSSEGQFGSYASKQIKLKLNPEGGTIYIYDRNKNLKVTQSYPPAVSRCSYARTSDGADTWMWSGTPTPGKSNNAMTFAAAMLDAPQPDTPSGILSAPKLIKVECPEGSKLIYTNNGSTPTLNNGIETGRRTFMVDKTSVLRFRAFKDGYLPSEVITRSFIFKDKDYTLPIVSIVTNPDNLYDDSIGVYTVGVNGAPGRGIGTKSNKNMDWERPVNFDYITAEGLSAVNQEATFYISGGWSRHWPPTSFKIKGEKRYQLKNSLNYPFFSRKPLIKNKAILMRNGGNDGEARCKDALIQRIVLTSGFFVDGQEWNPCHVFINGKYLAMLNMRETNNKFFGYSNYGIDTDEMDAFELGEQGFRFMAGNNIAYNRWYTLSNQAASATAYDEIKTLVDIDEYINYMAAEYYLGLSDWLGNNNNVKGFRSRNGGRFHFVLFDLDSALDLTDMLTRMKFSTSNSPVIIFNRMAKNEYFRRQFINAYCLVDGSIFTDKRVSEAAQYVGSKLDKPLSLEGKSPWGVCNYVKERVAGTRGARMEDLRRYFGLGAGSKLSIAADCSEATLMLDSQPIPTSKFQGTLFAPFTLTASAPAGYNFAGWKKGTTESKTLLSRKSRWSFYDKGSLDGQNWTTGSITGWSSGPAPLGYGKNDIATLISYGSNANDKRPTYYFRTDLYLAETPDGSDKIKLNFTADDGFVLYVNGKEAARHLMPNGPTRYDQYATTFAPGNPDVGSAELNADLFRKGNNIIAVEVHNNSGTSSDIYWDAEIIRTYNSGTEIITERSITFNSDEDCSLTAMFTPLIEECLIPAGSAPVVINEVSAGNSIFVNEYYKKNDWIELYNTTSEAIDIAGMYLSDDPAMPEKYEIPASSDDMNTVIPAHGYLVVWADKLNPLTQLHTNFKLANADNECVMLTAADRSWTDKLSYVSHNGDETVGRYPDGGKRIFKMTKPTPNAANIIGSYAQWIAGTDENFDEEAYLTGIQKPAQAEGSNDGNIYDMQGRKWSATDIQALPKGIYIRNGKKIIVK
jgi:hypothetical protein